VASHQSFLKISCEPYPLLHVLSSQEVLTLLHEFISAHLHILIEQIATEDLLAVTVVENVGGHEQQTKSALCDELHVLIVEEDVVVVEEQEL
jgi:hypothetical protein